MVSYVPSLVAHYRSILVPFYSCIVFHFMCGRIHLIIPFCWIHGLFPSGLSKHVAALKSVGKTLKNSWIHFMGYLVALLWLEIQDTFGRLKGYCEKSIKKENNVNELSPGAKAWVRSRLEAGLGVKDILTPTWDLPGEILAHHIIMGQRMWT